MMKKIQAHRERLGLTQTELAKKLGVSQPAIAYWENGVRTPNVYVLKKMAEIFGCPIDDLISDDGDKEEKSA